MRCLIEALILTGLLLVSASAASRGQGVTAERRYFISLGTGPVSGLYYSIGRHHERKRIGPNDKAYSVRAISSFAAQRRLDRRRFLRSSLSMEVAAPILPRLLSSHAWGPGEAKRGGTLTVATTAPTAVDPHQLQDPGGRAFVQPVVNYLVR